MDTPIEVEVKFHVPDLAALARRLEAHGARLEHARVLEVNTRFDDAAGSLYPRGMLLRLRQDRRARLTLKAPAGVSGLAAQMKAREEFEVEVSDEAGMRRILERLGFQANFVYEKYRTTYRLGACEVVLDELPIGTFAEVEGPAEDVRRQADVLGLDWEQRLIDSYSALFERGRSRLSLPARNMTFEEFQGVEVPGIVLRP